MLVAPGELLRIGARLWMRGAIGVALERDGRRADHRRLGEPVLERLILCLAIGQAEAPAVVVDRDRHMVGVLECHGAAIESGGVEVPLGRCGLPDELGEVMAVLLVARTAALCR